MTIEYIKISFFSIIIITLTNSVHNVIYVSWSKAVLIRLYYITKIVSPILAFLFYLMNLKITFFCTIHMTEFVAFLSYTYIGFSKMRSNHWPFIFKAPIATADAVSL